MSEQPSDQQPRSGPLLNGKTAAFAVYVCGAGLTYLSQIALARVIGMEAYGVYAYVYSIVTLFAYLAALGFDVSLLRFLPAYRSQGRWDLIGGVVVYAERNALRASAVIAAVGLGIVLASGHAAHHGMTLTFAAGFGLVPVYALLWIRCARVRAFGGIASALIPDRLVRDGFVLAAILTCALLLPAGAFGAPEAMAVTLLGGAAGLAMVTWAVRKQPQSIGGQQKFDSRPWRLSIFPLVAIALAEVAINRAGTLALIWADDPAGAGAYALAFSLSAVVILPRVAVNTQFAPMVADRFARGDMRGVQALLNQARLWAMLAATGIAGGLWFAAGPLLPLLFGPRVVGALPVLGILLVGQLIASGAGSQVYLLTMSGRERLAAAVLVGFALVDLVASVLLVSSYGLSGAAFATSACLVGMNIVMAIVVWNRLGIRPGSFGFPSIRWDRETLLRFKQAVLIRAESRPNGRKGERAKTSDKRVSMP